MDRRTFLKGALASGVALLTYGFPVEVEARKRKPIQYIIDPNSSEARDFIDDVEKLYRQALEYKWPENENSEKYVNLIENMSKYVDKSFKSKPTHKISSNSDKNIWNNEYTTILEKNSLTIFMRYMNYENKETNTITKDSSSLNSAMIQITLIDKTTYPNKGIVIFGEYSQSTENNQIKERKVVFRDVTYRYSKRQSKDMSINPRIAKSDTPEGKRIIKQALDKFFKEIRK